MAQPAFLKPSYYLDATAVDRYNPSTSWWASAPRDHFTELCAQEFLRMRLSRYGNASCSPGKPGLGTLEMYRAKRAMAGRVAHL